MTFEAFKEKSLEDWNVNKDPMAESAQVLVAQLLDQPEESWGESELGMLLQTLLNFGMNQATIEEGLSLDILQKAIIDRSSLGADSIEVQVLVKVLYEKVQEFAGDNTMSAQEFGRLYSSGLMEGQIGQSNQQKYGTDSCAFLADAIAIFGGYENYEDSM